MEKIKKKEELGINSKFKIHPIIEQFRQIDNILKDKQRQLGIDNLWAYSR